MFKFFFVLFIFLSCFLNAFSLKEGFIKTLANNPDVLVRENELKKIEYDMDIAKGLFYPTINFEASADNSRTSRDSYTPKNGRLESKDEYLLRLNQPLYDGFESSYEKKIQQNRYESAKFYLKEIQNELALRYVQNYINVLKTNDMLNLSNESYNMSKEMYNKTSRKVEMGYGTKLEYERAKGNLEESSVNLSIDKLSLADATQNLYDNIQEEFDFASLTHPIFSYNLPNNEDEALRYGFLNHPSVMVSLKNIDVAIFEQKRDLKSFHPDVNLVASYRLNDASYKENYTDTSNEYKVGLELVYNLYNGGKDLANNKKLLQTIQEKKILLQKTNQQISNKLSLSWNSYLLNAEKLAKLEKFVKTRKAVLDATYQEFTLGTRDLGSVVDAHLDYISTKRNVISTTYDLLLAHYRILDSIGILSDEILEQKEKEIFEKNDSKINEILKNNIR
jgi:adhesin transport system outer membrane protein